MSALVCSWFVDSLSLKSFTTTKTVLNGLYFNHIFWVLWSWHPSWRQVSAWWTHHLIGMTTFENVSIYSGNHLMSGSRSVLFVSILGKTNKNTSPLCMLKTENTEINYLCSANDLVVWVMFEGVTTLDYIMRWDSIFRFAPMNLGFRQKQWANHLLTTLTSWDMKPFVLVSSVYQNPDWLVMAGWNTT